MNKRKIQIGKNCYHAETVNDGIVSLIKVDISNYQENKTYYCFKVEERNDTKFFNLFFPSGEEIKINSRFVAEIEQISAVKLILDITNNEGFNSNNKLDKLYRVKYFLLFPDEEEYEIIDEVTDEPRMILKYDKPYFPEYEE